jgi:hypothetical protein
MQQAFDNLIIQLQNPQNPQSAETQNAMRMLNTTNPNDIETLINMRMQQQPPFFNSMGLFATATFEATERAFAATVSGLKPELWVNYVTYVRDFVQTPQQMQPQMQPQMQQPQQLRQQQQQLHLTPEQHAELQILQRSMFDNWERIRSKLFNCEDPHTKALSQLLNIDCNHFINILGQLDQAFTNSLFDETLNDEEQMHVAERFSLDLDKWIQVINFLRESLRRPFTQPDESFEMQTQSRALELSSEPRTGRPTPVAFFGMRGQDIDIDRSHNFDPAYLRAIINEEDDIFTEEEDKTTDEYRQKYEKYMKNQPYVKLILDVMGMQFPPITPNEHEILFGGAYSPKLIPAHILLQSFQPRFRKEDVDTAFEYACRAYLQADPRILTELERSEPEPKRLYVIARLMRHFLTFPFDRNEGMHLGGKKSRLRSKKRGRKSMHRRKKSSHKKRKSKKN